MLRKIIFLLLGLIISGSAQAELSFGLIGGLAQYTTKVRGDVIFAYNVNNRPYYQYPADITSSDFTIGVFGRYLYPVYPCYQMGLETGYLWIQQDTTRLRSDALFPSSINVEDFTTRSNGLALLNFIFRIGIAPQFNFSIFGGPAWLDTAYRENDFFDHISNSTGHEFQLTADFGMETDWNFYPGWSAGMRFDYIFDTGNRTVATRGALGTPLRVKATASSGALLVTGTIRYVMPWL